MINIAICGYGNLAKGVEKAVLASQDMKLTAVISRRKLVTDSGMETIAIEDVDALRRNIDVVVMCGGSASDLPEQSPIMLEKFNIVDSFDTHAKIPQHFAKMDSVGKSSKHLGLISAGWDPGLFSLARLYFQCFLPDGNNYTFWGKGVSQGHSDAIRRIEGVKNAVQYTVPIESALERVRSGENPQLSTCDKHVRECYVVAEEGADLNKIEKTICEMPNYFADYHTNVHFISEEELKRNHSAMPHGGFVLRSGKTSENVNHVLELAIKLDSNPEFTGSILTAYARAVARLAKEGKTGCVSVFDIAPTYLFEGSGEELRKNLL